jgi:hypothetical protein
VKIRTLFSSTAFTLATALAAALAVPAAAIEVSVNTSQALYLIGEDVEISVSLCNDSSEPVIIDYFLLRCYPPLREILSSPDEVIAFSTCDGTDGAGRTARWEPGECKMSRFSWPQTGGRFAHLEDPLGPQVPQGTYRVRVRTPFTEPGVSPDFAIVAAIPMSPSATSALLLALAGSGVWLLRRRRTLA